MASTDITLIGLDEATLSDDLVTVLADPSTNGGYKASVGDLGDYIIANAGLDYTDTATNGTYVKAVSESDGVISVTRETADTTPTEDSTKLITSGGVESALSMDLTSVSGNPITITDASNTNCETLIATLSPTQASGTPTPSNPLDISGVSTLTIDRTGRNLLDYATWTSETHAENGTLVFENNGVTLTATSTDSYTAVSTDMTPIRVLPNTTYTLSWESETNVEGLVYAFDRNINVIGYTQASSQHYTFTTPSDCKEIYFRVGVVTIGNTIHYKNIQIEKGSSSTTYEPYQGTTLSLSLGSTVYGGSVDLRSGVLTVDRGIMDLGDKNWDYQSNNVRFVASLASNAELPSSNSVAIDAISSAYRVLPHTSWDTNYALTVTADGAMTVKNTDYTDATTFKTAMNGVQLVYKLATPTTTQLTPQELRLLTGYNTLWTNAEGLEVEYQPNNFVGKLKAWILDQLS